jgi:hypothetical protein
VVQVYPAGPAARAGLWPGDIVQKVNGQQVDDSGSLISLIEKMEPGSKAELEVLRNNQPTKLTATLASRDSFIFHGGDFRGQGGDVEQSGYEEDEFSNIPPHAMQLEHDRRMAEQHQRIESELIKLQDEVRQLRELLQQRSKQ